MRSMAGLLPENSGLSPKRQKFVTEYLIDCNGAQAAIRAGYSPKNADVQGAQLLVIPSVAAAVQAGMNKLAVECGIHAKDVLNELYKLSYSSVKGLFDPSGRFYSIHDIPDALAAAISSIKVVTKTLPVKGATVEIEYITEIKFWDKRGSLELLGKHLKLFNDVGSKDNPLTIGGDLTDLDIANRLAAIVRAAKERSANGKP